MPGIASSILKIFYLFSHQSYQEATIAPHGRKGGICLRGSKWQRGMGTLAQLTPVVCLRDQLFCDVSENLP